MSITSQDLMKVYTATFEARTKWRNIFLLLGMSHASIEALSQRWRDNPDDCYREGLMVWLKSGERTWKELIDALSSPVVGHKDIANAVEKDHMQAAELQLSNSYAQVINENLTIFSNENIGTGAFGAVFKGSYKGSPCAVKVLNHTAKQITANLVARGQKASIQAFERECEFLESFQHPNVVQHLSTDEHPQSGDVILVIELLDCNLRSYLTDLAEESLTSDCQLGISTNVASGLAYIHSKKVVHRDLCGDNVLLKLAQPVPVAKISDFGMSRLIDPTTLSHSLSAVGHREGYLPPEALREDDELYDHSLDVFSLGVVMVQIARKLTTVKTAKDRKFHLGQIPATHPLKPLIDACVQEDKNKRPSAGDVCAALESGNINTDSVDTTEVDVVSAEISTVSVDPLQAVMVRREATADLQVMTPSSRPCTENVAVTCELVHVKSDRIFAGRVTKKADNTHTLSFTPTLRGRHVLRVCVNSQAVRDLSLLVAPDPASLRKPTRVISGLSRPCGVTTNAKGHIIVCEEDAHRVSVFMNGTKIQSIGSKGTDNGQFDRPRGVAVDRRGCIYVADNHNHRIQKFSSDGDFLDSAGVKGSGNLQFIEPDCVHYNRTTDMLYVVDECNHRIQVLTSDLTFHRAFGRPGRGDGELCNPAGVCCDDVGNVYVADSNNDRVHVFTADGKFVRMFGSRGSGAGQLRSPVGIAISSGLVYVTEVVGNRVSVFTLTGEFIGSFGGLDGLPTDVTVTENSIIVADSLNNRIQIFLVAPDPESMDTTELPPQSAPILPRNWTTITDRETEKVVYVNKTKAEEKVSTPPGYPLHQISTHPDVTFYDEPQQKEFTSSGGHFDFENGVEVTLPQDTIKAGSSVNIKVQACLAPKDVFVMPEGIQSASTSYLLSSEGADIGGEVTVTMEHHVRVATKEEADDLLFLQADSSPKRSGSKFIYEFKEVPAAKSQFIPRENKGRVTTTHFSFWKIGVRLKKWFTGLIPSIASNPPQTPEQHPPDRNLYTVRVYRSPPQTTGDRMAIICVSLFGKFYTKFIEELDKVVIPRDYPCVSKEAKDKTILGSRVFEEMCASLRITPVQGWSALPDKEEILKQEVDLPETDNYKPEDLHDYPPRMVCTFRPKRNAPEEASSTVYVTGLQPEVKVHIPLMASPKPPTVVDTQQLEQATENLKATVCGLQASDSQLGSTVDSILSLIDRMTSALKSSFLGDLAVYTESIKREIKTIREVSTKIAEECKRQTIRDNIGANLSKMEALSHQLNQVTRVKLRHCQDQSEETAALVDLEESGTSLLRTVDCLLKTLSGFSSTSITDLCNKHRISTADLSKEVSEDDILNIYPHLENWELVATHLGLTPPDKEAIKHNAYGRIENMRLYMLQKWRSVGLSKEPSTATFRVLMEALLKCKCKYSADQVCKLLSQQSP